MNFEQWVSLPSTKELGDIDLERYYYEKVAEQPEFLEWYKTQDLPTYEKPSVAIDLVAFTFEPETGLSLLLIQRGANPYRGAFAFAGGFVNPNESADEACLREVKEELGIDLSGNKIVPMPTVTTPNRDPRTWVISLPYIVFLTPEQFHSAIEGDDAGAVVRVNLGSNLEKLETLRGDFAFDHFDSLQTALGILKTQATTVPMFLNMLGEFTVREACAIINFFAGKEVATPNHFLSKYGDFVVATGWRRGGRARPSRLYLLNI